MSGPMYCTCETPVMDAEHDAGCRRCGLPVDFSPPPPARETQLTSKRPWPCEATCEAPGCAAMVAWVLHFENPETPGLTHLYLCDAHANETQARYRARGAVASGV